MCLRKNALVLLNKGSIIDSYNLNELDFVELGRKNRVHLVF